jgi:transcriptional regulator with XRE-family HTH domain
MSETIRYEDFLEVQLQDPEFRAYWERTAFARAIAIQIIRYRAEHGLSQTALARRLGVSQASVGRLELGEHEPKISTLRNLSEKLGMRFLIDIHPQGQDPAAISQGAEPAEQRVERIVAGGVEMLVSAG